MQSKSLAALAALAAGIGHVHRIPAHLTMGHWTPPPTRRRGPSNPAGTKLARQVAKRRLDLATIR